MTEEHALNEQAGPPTEDRLSRRDILKLALGGIVLPVLPSQSNLRLLQPQPARKRLYIAPDDHTDLFWAADEQTYHDAFLRMIDYYLDMADATDSVPSDFQSRWNCDGSYWMWVYERNRSEQEFNRLIERIRDGHFSVPLNALCTCLGGAPTENVLRGMYYPGKIERTHDLRFRLAYSIENQTLSYGLASLWAGSGAKYSWKGICGCDSSIALGRRQHEIYWWEGIDGQRILMKWHSMLSGNQNVGGYAEIFDPTATINFIRSNSFQDVFPYDVIGAFGQGWDAVETINQEAVNAARTLSDGEYRIIVSNEEDFFVDFENTYGSGIPVVSAAFGNEWELYVAAMTEVTARVRRATEKLRAAEVLATYAVLLDPSFMDGRAAARDVAWMAMGLFWEHNWGATNTAYVDQRIAWQRRLADEIDDYINSLHADALSVLSTHIENDSSGAVRFFVFNPLSWTRTDAADVREGLLPGGLTDPFHVVDVETGATVASQIISRDSNTYLRILAADIPPLGYKTYELRPGQGQDFDNAATVNGATLENPYYRVTLNRSGAITSLIAKTSGDRQLVRGGGVVNDMGAGAGTVTAENVGPVSVTLVANAAGPLPHTTRVTLYRNHDRVEIENRITASFGDTRIWDYDFAVDNPYIWHEEVGAVILAKLTTAGGHYAEQDGRYDWLTLNHFVDVSSSGGPGVTLSNWDCHFFRIGSSTPNTLDMSSARIAVLIGGRVGGVAELFGIPDQGGDDDFLQRFALRAHGNYDPASAMRFALEHQNPFVTGVINPTSPTLPGDRYSLLSISDPDILLWAFKPADDDAGKTVARLWNVSSMNHSALLSFNNHRISDAQVISHIETPEGNVVPDDLGALPMRFTPQQMRSYMLKLERTGSIQNA